MTIAAIKNTIENCINDVLFSYNGQSCGVTSEVHDYKPIYTLWFGEKYVDLDTVEDVLNYKLFDGKSLNDIYKNLSINIA